MINKFDGEYFFLSNYFPCQVYWREEGDTHPALTYQISEAAFQAAKAKKFRMRRVFSHLPADESKYLGKHVELRSDWEEVKDEIMLQIVRAKFTQNKGLRQKLLDTGDEELVEGTTWHDTYWGIDLETGKGENHLGKILMQVRAEFQAQEAAKQPKELYAKCTSFTAGMSGDGEKCREYLILNQYYKVEDVDMGSWITYITLKGMPKISFNSANFDFYAKNAQGKYIPHDIYGDPEYNEALA